MSFQWFHASFRAHYSPSFPALTTVIYLIKIKLIKLCEKNRAVTPTILELSTEKFACLQLSLHSFRFSFMIKTTKMLAILKANPPSPPLPHLQCRLTMPLSHNLVSSFRSFFKHIQITSGCCENKIQLYKRHNVEITLGFRTFCAYVGNSSESS